MRHDEFMDKPKYFEGTLPDSLRKLIDTTFLKNNFKTDYAWSVNDGTIYEGFTYCFDLTKSNTNKKIIFIPRNSPSEMKLLATLLDTVIYSKATIQVDTINIKSYKEELRRNHIAQFGQLPRITKEPPKFERVETPK